jgi:hypothetical protein
LPETWAVQILIINANPDASAERLTARLARACGEGAIQAGHEGRYLDVGSVSFSFLKNAAEFAKPAVDPDIVAAQHSFRRAEHFVFVYPVWFGGIPALSRAFPEASLWRIPGCNRWWRLRKRQIAKALRQRNCDMGNARHFVPAHISCPSRQSLRKEYPSTVRNFPVRTTCLGDLRISCERSRMWIEQARNLGQKTL